MMHDPRVGLWDASGRKHFRQKAKCQRVYQGAQGIGHRPAWPWSSVLVPGLTLAVGGGSQSTRAGGSPGGGGGHIGREEGCGGGGIYLFRDIYLLVYGGPLGSHWALLRHIGPYRSRVMTLVWICVIVLGPPLAEGSSTSKQSVKGSTWERFGSCSWPCHKPHSVH